MAALQADSRVPALNTDILIIIFEILRDVYGYGHGWETFRDLRLLSKQFNDIVLPINFRRQTVSYEMIECFETYLRATHQIPPRDPEYDKYHPETKARIDSQLKVAEYTRRYTRHLDFDEELYLSVSSWESVPKMLTSLRNLKEITWRYWGRGNAEWGRWRDSIQYKVLGCPLFRAQIPEVRISVKNFCRYDAMHYHEFLVNLVSCTEFEKEFCDDPRSGEGRFSFESVIDVKNLLLASPKMEEFDLVLDVKDDAAGDWRIQKGERLPPFKDLSLYSVNWPFSPREAVQFWDWSRIAHLRLDKVPLIPFLKTVTPEHLTRLRTFTTDCWKARSNVEEASKLICNLVNKNEALEELSIRCLFRTHIDDCLLAIMKQGRSLRLLSLRDFSQPRDCPKSSSSLTIDILNALSSACPNLTHLDFDVGEDVWNVEKSIKTLSVTLASFRNLTELRLHYQASWRKSFGSEYDAMIAEAEELYEFWIERLIAKKQGLPFRYIHVHVEETSICVPHRHQQYYLPRGSRLWEPGQCSFSVTANSWDSNCSECREGDPTQA